MKSFVDIPNVDPDVVDWRIYTLKYINISVTLDNSVEARVNALFQRVINVWYPSTFIYNTKIDLIAVFVYFTTYHAFSTINIIYILDDITVYSLVSYPFNFPKP